MERQQKQQNMRRATLCGMTALGYLVALYGVQTAVWLLLTPLMQGAAFSESQNMLLLLLTQVLALAIPVVPAIRAAGLSAKEMCWRRAPKGAVRQWMPIFLGTVILANLAGSLLAHLFHAPLPQVSLPVGGPALLLNFAAMCLLPALGEELLFRGVLQGLLRPLGPGTAVLGGAVLFSLLHGSVPQCVTALLCGLVLGICAQTTGSLVPGIWLHLTNNTIAFVSLYLDQYGGGAEHILLLTLLLPLWGLWALRKYPVHLKKQPDPWIRPLLHSPGYLLAAAALAVLCIARSFALL